MKRRRRERAVAAGLWCLFLAVAFYVSWLLFPEGVRRLGEGVQEGMKETARQAVSRLFLEAEPVIPYVFGMEKEERRKDLFMTDPSYEEYLKMISGQPEQQAQEAQPEQHVQKAQLEQQIQETQPEQQVQEAQSEQQAQEAQPEQQAQEAQPVRQAAAVPLPEDRLARFQAMGQRGGYTFEQMMSFDYLVQNLYVVSAGTSITPVELVPEVLLSKDLSITENGEYQILIYHTHSQEAYADSVPGDISQTVVGMGDLLQECLEGYGYSVLHHKGIYDMTDGQLDRDPAYTKALPVLSSILEAHPEIQVTIDLHRDGVKEDVHLVQEINGKQTARIMYFNGLCRSETGEIDTLPNPNREENLAFSLQMALTTMADYPGLTRCIYLRSNRYNLHLRGKSALIEVGAQTNTVEEIRNAIPILADVLHKVLSNEQK